MDILIEEKNGCLWTVALENNENHRLEGLEIDSPYEEVRWGSIYWAKVKTIDKALDAVFLDLDGDNTGILYNKDVRTPQKDGTVKKGGDTAIGKTLSPGDMIAVQAKSSYLIDSATPQEHTKFEDKIPQMSMDIAMQGRYLIYCPMMQKNRLSLRIQNKGLREQLHDMLDKLDDIKGCILRASAANMQTDVLIREGRIIKETWDQVQAHLEGAEPCLIMLGPDAIQRMLSDQADKQIDTIEVVTMDHFNAAEEWCSVFAPDLVTKIQPQELDSAQEDLALLHDRDITGEIEALFHAYTFLPGGGNIILQETAALSVIDINKGADKGSHLDVNTQAMKEIARQLRLRNIGGMVIVDFLRMNNKKDQAAFKTVIDTCLNADPCTTQCHGRTRLGLYEFTRKRRTPPLSQKFDGNLE